MKLISLINEDINHSSLDNVFYRKCLNLFSSNFPEIKNYFLSRVNCEDCYLEQSLIQTKSFKVLKKFFYDDLHLEHKQVNDLIFLYIINLNVDNFLTDKLSTGEEYTLTYITCTDEIKEDIRDTTERCDNCDGSGVETCNNCDGDGSLECSYCDGSGVENIEIDDNEEEEIECEDCGGSGTETCNDCDGDGVVSCSYCGGSGEWYDREQYYILEEIQYTLLSVGDFKKSISDHFSDDNIVDFFENNSDIIYMVLNKSYGDVYEEVHSDDLPFEENEITEIESYDNYVTKFGTMGMFK